MSDIINIIIWAMGQIAICVCWYQLGRNNGIYKMQIISLELIGDLAKSMLKYIVCSDGLNLSDEQSDMIQKCIAKNTIESMDKVPSIKEVNKLFKFYHDYRKEEVGKEND